MSVLLWWVSLMSSQLAAALRVIAMVGGMAWAQEAGSCHSSFQVASRPPKATLQRKQVGLVIGCFR